MKSNSDNNNCVSCLYSIKHNNATACGKGGDFLRMFIRLRRIANPQTKTCNQFTPIPSHVSKTCRYCRYFGDYNMGKACWNVGVQELLHDGPRLKLSAETCHKFEIAEQFKETKIKERSR
jgi:hypothetical protein